MYSGLCHAALCTPPLSADAQLKLFALPSVDWAKLWDFVLKYQGNFVGILEQALSLLPGGAVWADLLVLIEDIINKQPLPPTPVPVPVPTPTP